MKTIKKDRFAHARNRTRGESTLDEHGLDLRKHHAFSGSSTLPRRVLNRAGRSDSSGLYGLQMVGGRKVLSLESRRRTGALDPGWPKLSSRSGVALTRQRQLWFHPGAVFVSSFLPSYHHQAFNYRPGHFFPSINYIQGSLPLTPTSTSLSATITVGTPDSSTSR